ncbi:hypothetical protein ACO0M4_08425 [Streptomyces sp. RGM 3693]|uniref:hypothetical protein n=1 Tax=Streptomyces sp. RGM 3693 TaxID=3413284 RepID=UPI003D277974
MPDGGEPLVPDNRRSRHVPLRTGVIKYEYDIAMGGVEIYSEVLDNDPAAGSGAVGAGSRRGEEWAENLQFLDDSHA